MKPCELAGGARGSAREVLPAPVHEYLATGARDSRERPRGAGWSECASCRTCSATSPTSSMSTSLLGEPAAVPWGSRPPRCSGRCTPTASWRWPRRRAAAGSVLVVSSNAGTPFSEIGATGVRWWLQAYLPADRTLAEPMLARAVAAGAEAVVLTVDTPVVGTKYAAGEQVVWDVDRPRRSCGSTSSRGTTTAPGAEKATDLGPHDLGWLAGVSGLPVVVKGVLRADDARRCAQAGAARGLGLQPRRPPARPDRDARRPRLAAVVDGGGDEAAGLRRRGRALGPRRAGRPGARRGRGLPRPAAALGAGRGRGRRGAGCTRTSATRSTEALRLAGCRSLADTRGIAVPPEHP